MVRRHEILLLYDVKDANPNGDPARENMPRYDPDTETVFVSDVRIKRTIRDCLESRGERVFVTGTFVGEMLEPYERENRGIDRDALLRDFIDLRLFGQVLAYKERGAKEETSYGHIHGPVQFRFGRSLNRTRPQRHKLSSKQPRAEGETTGKFGERWTVPYALIGTYGVVNEAVAAETGLTEEDVRKMLDCLWRGTEQLQSTSKAVHRPVLLIDIAWKEGREHLVGNLDQYVRIKKDGRDITWDGESAEEGKQIRCLRQIVIDVTALAEILEKYREDIDEIHIRVHPEATVEGLERIQQLTGG